MAGYPLISHWKRRNSKSGNLQEVCS